MIYQFDVEDAKRFAREQNIRIKERGDELVFARCPYCGETTTKKDKFAINANTGMFKCMRASCGAHGNMITLSRDFGFSLGNMVDEYYRPQRKYRTLIREGQPEPTEPAIAYLAKRGISEETAKRYHITTKKDQDNVIVFPFYDEDDKLQFVKYRKADFQKGRDANKEWCEANCKPILFGMDQCYPGSGQPLILTEGQIDSLSVAECGINNAVSVPTGANGFTWVPYCWNFMGKFKTLIVFGDYEHGKITLLEEMRVRFHGTVKHVRPEDYKGCKDANEILTKYGKDAVVSAIQNAVPVLVPKIDILSDVKRKSLSEMERISTGVRSLDRTIGGLYFGQLIIVTGASGTGKSTVVSYMCVHAIRQGYNVMLYSGELPAWMLQDWFDRQAAGPTYINTIKSDRYIEEHSIDASQLRQIHGWYSDNCYFYNYEDVKPEQDEHEALTEIFEKAITQYNCRVIMIDNLMTAVDDDMASDIYKQQSAFVRKLAVMAKTYNVIIFLVAHPRKTYKNDFQNDDISGSGNITNLADVVLRYARLPEDDSRDFDRILQVTKNRLGGKLNLNGIGLYFDEKSKRISENPGDFNELMGWEDPESGFLAMDEMEEIPF